MLLVSGGHWRNWQANHLPRASSDTIRWHRFAHSHLRVVLNAILSRIATNRLHESPRWQGANHPSPLATTKTEKKLKNFSMAILAFFAVGQLFADTICTSVAGSPV